WDAATGQPLGQTMEHQGDVWAVAFSPDGKRLLTGSGEGIARLWDAAELPDNLPRLSAWVSVVTGLELDEEGAVRVLDATAWGLRRQTLDQLGGPPDSGGDRLLDPIPFGPDP